MGKITVFDGVVPHFTDFLTENGGFSRILRIFDGKRRSNTATYGFFAKKIAVFSHFTGFLTENGGHFRNFLKKIRNSAKVYGISPNFFAYL